MSLQMIIAVLLGISSLAGIYRLVIGPSLTDRVIGLDLLFAIAIAYCLIAAWISERTVYLDVAIGIALTGFVATLAWSHFIQMQSRHQSGGSS
jgi:multicomponent Na+:H+ antiporter subunit F